MPGPLIVQSDKTVLLEVDHADAAAARIALAPFAELERAPEHVHTYRITPLALWNARAAGHDAEQVVDVLERYSRFPVPQALLIDVAETMSRYGRVRLHAHPAHGLILESEEVPILEELSRHKKVSALLGARIDDHTFAVPPSERGRLKQELLKANWPVEDLAGYVDGESHPVSSWRKAGRCATTSPTPQILSGPAVPASSSYPVAQARPSWARPPWPRPRPPRSSS